MPKEITDRDKFMEIVERAEEIRVKKLEKEGIAKVKARTKRYLYTIKIPLDQLDEFLQKIKEKVGEEKIVYF
ncbi:5'-nucleotidase [Desulfurococcaceae archaeon MEX13E-LK6-19]|nr:5'-nucleotidase [Desulfurococcaceae archaeon MEX13E-LK6-19]